MTTQLFVASTAFGVATLAAAIDDHAFGDPMSEDPISEYGARRVLVVTNNAAVPETMHEVTDVIGIETLLTHFEAVYSYNEAVAPHHPTSWRPREMDLPLWERHFRLLWDLGDDHLRLVVESIQGDPARALCEIFVDAEIDVYADGLMSYGPTRTAARPGLGQRIRNLHHLDLVPGLAPVLLTEWDVEPKIISSESFRKTIARVRDAAELSMAGEQPADEEGTGNVAVLLGHFLSSAYILTEEEEEGLHLDMVRGAVGAGYRQLIFKPHPTAPTMQSAPLLAEAESLGAELTIHDQPELAETWFTRGSVRLVVGCFSTALMTAASCYGLPAARVGTTLLLERLRPYENSNRIPVTLVDALLPALERLSESSQAVVEPEAVRDRVSELVKAVSYAMQPKIYPELRDAAETFLTKNLPASAHYFKVGRLTRLKLPGARQAPARKQPVPQRTDRLRGLIPPKIRRGIRRAFGETISARVGRMSKAIRTSQGIRGAGA